MIRESCIYPADQKLIIVLDNSRAHDNEITKSKMKYLNMEALFMPPYSPELNSIETLWGIVKLRWKQEIASDVQTKILTLESFNQKIAEVLQF